MTSPTPPVVITGPKPTPFPLSDPLAMVLDDAMQLIAKVVSVVPPASSVEAVALSDIVQGLVVAAVLVSPLDGEMLQRLNTLRGYYNAADVQSLAAWYNDVPLHPNLSRWFAWFYLRLLGVAI